YGPAGGLWHRAAPARLHPAAVTPAGYTLDLLSTPNVPIPVLTQFPPSCPAVYCHPSVLLSDYAPPSGSAYFAASAVRQPLSTHDVRLLLDYRFSRPYLQNV